MPPSLAPFRKEIDRLCAAHRVRRLGLFGSARGKALPADTSDVDFVVEFDDISAADYANHYFGLRQDLTQLLGRDVDLVVERAIRNPYFLAEIRDTREPLFGS